MTSLLPSSQERKQQDAVTMRKMQAPDLTSSSDALVQPDIHHPARRCPSQSRSPFGFHSPSLQPLNVTDDTLQLSPVEDIIMPLELAMTSMRSRDSNSQYRASIQNDVTTFDRDISVSLLEVAGTSIVCFPSMSIASNSQSVVSSSNKRCEMAYVLTKHIKADNVVTLLHRLYNKTGSNMPHKCEKHLPHFTKKHVYETYVAKFTFGYPSKTCPSLPYFFSVWKKEKSFIKARKVPVFTKCA